MPKWLQKILRWEPGISLGQWIYDRMVATWPRLLAWIGGAVMIGLGWITDWLSALGPAGVFGVAVIFGLFILAGLSWVQSLNAKARLRRIHANAVDKWKEQVDQLNPLDNVFHNKRLKISDLMHPVTHSIKNKKFTDCELIGPANLFFVGGGTVINVTFGDCDVIALKPLTQPPWPINNAIRFEDIEMIGGSVWNCTLIIRPSEIQHFIEMGANVITLTGRPEIDNLKPIAPEAKTQP